MLDATLLCCGFKQPAAQGVFPTSNAAGTQGHCTRWHQRTKDLSALVSFSTVYVGYTIGQEALIWPTQVNISDSLSAKGQKPMND